MAQAVFAGRSDRGAAAITQLALRATATVEQVYLGIASIGGHLKRNGAPGWQTFIRGFADVAAALKGVGVTTVFQVAINP